MKQFIRKYIGIFAFMLVVLQVCLVGLSTPNLIYLYLFIDIVLYNIILVSCMYIKAKKVLKKYEKEVDKN